MECLKGDMSIVGPRPEVKKYVEMFKDDYKEVLKVKRALQIMRPLNSGMRKVYQKIPKSRKMGILKKSCQ